MILDSNATYLRKPAAKDVKGTAPHTPTFSPALPQDKVEVDFHGHRPAHRNVKKMARAAAGAVGLAGIGKAVFDVATAGSVLEGLSKVAIDLACSGAGVVGIDLASGLAHHWGDNFGLPDPKPLDHTKWHTDTDNSGYCLVGLSNGALDKAQFWPKWERAVHKLTGKTPLSWKVEPYRQYVAGQLDRDHLEKTLDGLGIHHG
jgi:hypothetical protein